jgi:hypothetical protein
LRNHCALQCGRGLVPDSGGSINTSLTAPPPHQSSCSNPEPYSP